ncbi:hypothetical protein K456DRAFT_1918798 [Colletotrichum gloeosporioides 23]|nr:hypothetical protein K456DRAFT_1918798 [Colletotrichum gloeosporioides 23]
MSYTPTTHNASYEAISATNPSISAAGKVVLITGAGSGIGNAASFSFATAGAKALILLGRRVEAFEVNIKGFLTLAQAMLAVTTSGQEGASQPVLIVLNTAGSIMPPLPGMGGYVASKMSSLKLAEYLASENKNKLRVISVHPGLIQTPMAEELEKAGLRFPYDDISLPSDFLVWAASQEAAFLNGKFVFANWDVEELKASVGKIEGGADLSLMLRGL